MSKRISFWNFSETILSFFRNDATFPRVWQLPDKDGTIAMLDDITGAFMVGSNNLSDVTVPATALQNIGGLEKTSAYSTKTDADYTLAVADFSVLTELLFSSASAHILTIPLNSSIAIPIGRRVYFRRIGAGPLTITPSGGVTLATSSGGFLDAGQNRLNSLEKTGTDTWYLDNGGLLSISMQQITVSAQVLTFTNMAAGVAEVNGTTFRYRTKFNLSAFTQLRTVIGCSTLGASGAGFNMQYSTDDSSFTDIGTGTGTNLATVTAAGTNVSDWITIPAGALGEVFLRCVSRGGDGVADPVVGTIAFQVR